MATPTTSPEEVRFKTGDRWTYGTWYGSRAGDESLYVFVRGACRSIMPDRIEVGYKGPRGGRKWKPFLDHSAD